MCMVVHVSAEACTCHIGRVTAVAESTPSVVQRDGRRKGGADQLTALHASLSVC